MAITGPFSQTKFCGASVTSFQSHAGWQEQATTLQVNLVEDRVNGDRFIPPVAGTPLSFVMSGYRFDGIVERWGESKSANGGFTYSVELGSPSKILQGVKLVIDVYRGVALIFPNLLNVFGYLEAGGASFGGSQRNEGGIPWHLIQGGIVAIQAGGTPYAVGIRYLGHSYIFDLGALPSVPSFYRMSGSPDISFMEAITRLCTDAGHEFILLLRMGTGTGPHTITVKTRSLLVPQPLGQIDSFVSGRDDILEWDKGTEYRNEVTCGVVVGANIEACTPQVDPGDYTVIAPYFGPQQSGTLVPFGTKGNLPPNPWTGKGNTLTVQLDASSISDVIGTPTAIPVYPCSILEMRLALSGFDAWSAFIARFRTDVATMVGLSVYPSIFTTGILDANPESLFTNDTLTGAMFAEHGKPDPAITRLERIWDFVKGVADQYLGKQFLVRLPFFLKYYFESETNNLLYNWDANDTGYFPDYAGIFSQGPLGLDYQYFNQFTNEQGKFYPYVQFSDLTKANLTSVNPKESVYQSNGLFMKCMQDAQIFFAPAPCMLITLSEPLWEVSPDIVGGFDDVAALLGITPTALQLMVIDYGGEFPIKIHPMPMFPDGAAICTRSNEATYGPWAKVGVDGPVRIELSQNLSPWEYGGFTNLDAVAQAQLADIGALVQQMETGSVKVANAPEISLGETLGAAGPVINSIDVEVGTGGVITTYRMKSENQRFGSFSRENSERMHRLVHASQAIRRDMRDYFTRIRDIQKTLGNNAKWRFQERISEAVLQEYAQNVMQAEMITDLETGEVRARVMGQKFAGSIGASNANDADRFLKTATMGLEGLYRPFSTSTKASGIPHYEKPRGTAGTYAIAGPELNPLKERNDIMWAAYGPEFSGFYTRNKNFDKDDARMIGFKGPMQLIGYGYDMDGKPVPNLNEASGTLLNPTKQQDLSASEFVSGYMARADLWKAGGVDLRWCNERKVWGVPGIELGKVSGNYVVLDGKTDAYRMEAPLGPVTDGAQVIVGYSYLKSTWLVIAQACLTT